MLNACPFCGGEAEIISIFPRYTKKKKYKVFCTGCNARTQETKLKREAIEQWNRRVK